ncbi:hypothetical protein JDV02_010161 [Purpureocillium takamizusanense]|uniref:Uncharacterized protein n=1 Tax=Purpureocillium takamizusanense TaxID=2060973 RepID=A0A9Q8QNF3_9HYPO|nr:uncharacterized protein JDV02_010161 [Purpureocillium takamizusanense]UNI24414.1 hypothetical protein JDV02_010161 [Purpureocillium takamizusanense]
MARCSFSSDFRAASTPHPTTPRRSSNPPLRRHEVRLGGSLTTRLPTERGPGLEAKAAIVVASEGTTVVGVTAQLELQVGRLLSFYILEAWLPNAVAADWAGRAGDRQNAPPTGAVYPVATKVLSCTHGPTRPDQARRGLRQCTNMEGLRALLQPSGHDCPPPSNIDNHPQRSNGLDGAFSLGPPGRVGNAVSSFQRTCWTRLSDRRLAGGDD